MKGGERQSTRSWVGEGVKIGEDRSSVSHGCWDAHASDEYVYTSARPYERTARAFGKSYVPSFKTGCPGWNLRLHMSKMVYTSPCECRRLLQAWFVHKTGLVRHHTNALALAYACMSDLFTLGVACTSMNIERRPSRLCHPPKTCAAVGKRPAVP
jgi:hypothetical protein